jgi:TolA-binding protein
VLVVLVVCAAAALTAQGTSEESLAQRRLDSGRAFARQNNYAEALRDFQAVVESYPASSVADNALLEIARY